MTEQNVTPAQEPVTSRSIGLASWQVYNLHCANSRLRGKAQRVAAHLAMRHNKTAGYAFPPITEIMAACNLSRASVDRAIAEIKASGEWIVVTGRGGIPGQAWVSNRYYPSAALLTLPDGAGAPVEEEDPHWAAIIADEPAPEDAPLDEPEQQQEQEQPEPREPVDFDLTGVFDDLGADDEAVGEQPQHVRARPVEEPQPLAWFEEIIRDAYTAHDSALWARYTAQVTDEQRTVIETLCSSIRDSGADLRLTLDEALERTDAVRHAVLWLLSYGLNNPRKHGSQSTAASDEHGDFMMHGVSKLTDDDYDDGGMGF